MTRPNNLPTLGVAIALDDIDRIDGLRPFIFDRNRDVEIRGLTEIGALADGAWQETAAQARKILNGHIGRVGIHGPYLGFNIDTPDPDIRAIAKSRLDAALNALIQIDRGRGVGHMVVHSPFTTWHWYNRGTYYDDCAEILEMTHLCLKEAVVKAEDHGLTLVIENCEDKDPHERVALAASFASPAVKVSVDTGHAHYAHGATGAPPVDVFIRAAKDALAHVHLQDADGFGDRHWAIGQGNILWPSVFAAIAELRDPPRLMLEMAHATSILPSARWLADRALAQ